MSQAKSLREMLNSPGPIVIAGAHNGLSAKLVQEAGYEGIWASGFEISATHGIPDANILTMADNIALARQMVDAAEIPVVADCDNGYGNAINVIHMVKHYEAAGVSAVCIEDNSFPKRCSFYAGVKRELAPIEEHVGKIKAVLETRKSKDFLVIARTEALIAGWGMEEALKRARAYADAGADMVLIHSKSKEATEVKDFAKAWDRKTPLVCVPTTYDSATVSELHEAGFKMIICANHALRSSIKAMRETLHTMRKAGSTGAVKDMVVPLTAVYEIIGVQEMKEQEASYLPSGGTGVSSIVLDAGYEKELGSLIEDKPRAMLDIRGKTILERQIDGFNSANIKDVIVVRGYKKDAINLPNIRSYDNDEYESTGEAVSLFKADKELNKRVVVSYGDVLFEQALLEKLLRSSADITIAVDRSVSPDASSTGRDFVLIDAPAVERDSVRFLPASKPSVVRKIATDISAKDASGEFVGMMMLSEQGCRILREAWQSALSKKTSGKFHEAQSVQQAKLTDLLQEVIDQGGQVQAVEVYKGWTEIDSFEDYQRAWATIR
ncbi:MAG: isocitrate lyase/phosphoenolpyruvate mutase family protein [Myxococcales bacterium]|nr:MAG: isocitrate lyase/phosphoenolpyruvate mutase family protein [Myxococcales bacterium]